MFDIKNLYQNGNREIIEKTKIGILASRIILPHLTQTVIKYIQQLFEENVIFVGGWHCPIEFEIHKQLIKKQKPHIHLGAKSVKNLFCILGKDKVLFMTHCNSDINRITRENALKRNRFLCELCDILIIPWLDPSGKTHNIVSEFSEEKAVYVFDREFNIKLIERGAQLFSIENVKSNIEVYYANN